MRCPACQNPVIENDAACRHCGFTLEAADRHFGIAPSLTKPVADLVQVLSGSEKRKLDRAAQRLLNRFPQLDVAVVLAAVPAHIPLGVYAFWLFNRGQLSSASESGGGNHLVLCVIDTATHRAAAMSGYGFEPFLPEAQLHMCLNNYSQTSQRDGITAGILAFWKELDMQLTNIHRQIPRLYGLQGGEQDAEANL
ncbi:MAG: hypothetical protein U1F81_19985 [Verrucomicrobiaceae bacterium]